MVGERDVLEKQAAVVGLGGMGRRHIQALQNAQIHVLAICDIQEETAESVKKEYGLSADIYTHWQTLLQDKADQLDVLIIASNGPSHAAMAMAAAQAGIAYILCEKPMATNGRDARLMAEVCQKNNIRLAINFSRRFMDRFIRLKQVLQGGIIGDISHFNLTIGAGGIGCIGTHFFDFVSWLLDKSPIWVMGTVESNPAPNVRGTQFLDPGGKGLVGYANDMTAFFELSENVPVGASMHISGSEGFVTFDGWRSPDSEQFSIFVRPKSQRTQLKTRFVQREAVVFDAGASPDIVLAAQLALEDLLGDYKEDTVSAGIQAVDTVMAIHLSAQENWKRINLPLSGDHLNFDVPIT